MRFHFQFIEYSHFWSNQLGVRLSSVDIILNFSGISVFVFHAHVSVDSYGWHNLQLFEPINMDTYTCDQFANLHDLSKLICIHSINTASLRWNDGNNRKGKNARALLICDATKERKRRHRKCSFSKRNLFIENESIHNTKSRWRGRVEKQKKDLREGLAT